MLNKIRALFDADDSQGKQDRGMSLDQCQLATAALLIEVANADSDFDAEEMKTLKKTLAERFKLDAGELDELTDEAASEQEGATSLYQFTQLINQECQPEDKYQLLKAMWEVAYADGNLDKYEEHLIRRVAELIYVPHNEFIRAKLETKDGRE